MNMSIHDFDDTHGGRTKYCFFSSFGVRASSVARFILLIGGIALSIAALLVSASLMNEMQ
jgi:ABC-type lipoprotein release transport system permease subunit